MADVKAEYAKLKGLPDFKPVDNEFEISGIENTKFLLRQINKKAMDRIDMAINILMDILQPDTGSFVNLYECAYFTSEDKKKAVELHRRAIILQRSLLTADIAQDDSRSAGVITEVVDKWPAIRKEIALLIEKLRVCWESPAETKEILEYLG